MSIKSPADPATPPLTRIERRRRETRQRILTATAELQADHGYAKLTVRAIADRADIGIGTFYLFFHNKDDVVWTLLEAGLEATRLALLSDLAPLLSPDREIQAGARMLTVINHHRPLLHELLIDPGSPVIAERYRDYLERYMLAVLQANVLTRPAPLTTPDDVLAALLGGAAYSLSLYWLRHPTPYTAADLAAMFRNLVFSS